MAVAAARREACAPNLSAPLYPRGRQRSRRVVGTSFAPHVGIRGSPAWARATGCERGRTVRECVIRGILRSHLRLDNLGRRGTLRPRASTQIVSSLDCQQPGPRPRPSRAWRRTSGPSRASQPVQRERSDATRRREAQPNEVRMAKSPFQPFRRMISAGSPFVTSVFEETWIATAATFGRYDVQIQRMRHAFSECAE